MFESGKFYAPITMHYTDAEGAVIDLVRSFMEEEYCSFPAAVHDDMFDALSRIQEPTLDLVWPKTYKAPVDPFSVGQVSAGGWMSH